jgi:hypothetical protein
MSSSGTTTYNLTTSEIIREALELLGVVGLGQSIDAEDYDTCLRTLNMMVKSWQNEDIFMTHEAEATVFLVPGTIKYQLGGTNPARVGADPVIETSVSTSAVATDTTLVVGSTTGMTALDKIGVVVNDGTTHWTTIASVTNATTLELTDALIEDTDASNMVFSYTNQVGRPLKVISAHYRNSGGTDSELSIQQQDRKLNELNKLRYNNMPNKGTLGQPVSYFQDQQSNYLNLYVWPTASLASDRLKIVYHRVIEDFNNPADTADLPQSWMSAIAQSLAAQVAPKYGKEEKAASAIAPMAATSLRQAMESGKHKAKFKIVPKGWN